MSQRRLPLLLLLIVLSVPVAADHQDGVDALTISEPADAAVVAAKATGSLAFDVAAPTAESDIHLLARIVGDTGNWGVTVEPSEAVLRAGGTQTFVVEAEAARIPSPKRIDWQLEIQAVGSDLSSRTLTANGTVFATATDAILGRWENPLPAPLDNPTGAFLLNLAAWLAISQLTVWVLFPLLKRIAAATPVEEDRTVIQIINRPTFILMFTFGLKQSLEVFELPVWAVAALDRTWEVVLALALVWVIYRLWKEIVLSVGKRVASRTESELDDQLYPVFEKLGSVVILVAGLFYIVSSFGVDMTLFAAGGAVVSLVIAFAAQDTLGNFFAGVFILLDRPFRVGDRIELPEQDHWGDVQEIGLRTTKVKTQDNRMVIFPNAYIGSNAVVNHSYPDSYYRIQVEFRLPYGSDIEYIRKTLVESVRPVEGVYEGKPVEALLLAFTDHGQQWRLRWWINSYVDTRRMYDRVNSAVIKRLSAEGVRIPYQQFTLWDAHKLLERDSHGGLTPKVLDPAEHDRLAHAAEQARQSAEAQEAAEIEELRESARRRDEGDEEE